MLLPPLIFYFVCRVFANAESLFYYTTFSRKTKKLLSQEEVKRLLAQATAVNMSDSSTKGNIASSKREKGGQPNVNCGDMAVTELEDSQLSIKHDVMNGTKVEESCSKINPEAMATTDIDDNNGEKDKAHLNHHGTDVGNTGHTQTARDQQQTFTQSDRQEMLVPTEGGDGEIQQEKSTSERRADGWVPGAASGYTDSNMKDTHDQQYMCEQHPQQLQNELNYEDYNGQIEVL